MAGINQRSVETKGDVVPELSGTASPLSMGEGVKE